MDKSDTSPDLEKEHNDYASPDWQLKEGQRGVCVLQNLICMLRATDISLTTSNTHILHPPPPPPTSFLLCLYYLMPCLHDKLLGSGNRTFKLAALRWAGYLEAAVGQSDQEHGCRIGTVLWQCLLICKAAGGHDHCFQLWRQPVQSSTMSLRLTLRIVSLPY